jgi:hypothetical protein
VKRDNPTLRQEQFQAGKPQGMLMERLEEANVFGKAEG